jgi:hypothetical protein
MDMLAKVDLREASASQKSHKTISWSGGQTFFSAGEARDLHGFLRRIYKPVERPSIPVRLERRTSRQSHIPDKRKEQQANPQPDQDANEVQKTSLEFWEYNGWVNRPTWNVYTVMTSYEDTSEALHRMASQQPGGMGNVRRAVLGSVEHWKNNRPSPYEEAAQTLVQDFLMNGVRRVEWTPVVDMLRGEQEALPEDANPLTTLAYELLSQTDWQAVVKDAAGRRKR